MLVRRTTDSARPWPAPGAGARAFAAILLGLAAIMSCDSPIEPPTDTSQGAIRGVIEYVSAWPPRDEFRDLRFVAMRFIPQDTADFLQLNRLEFSDRLTHGAESQTVLLTEVPTGTYPFAVVARQRTTDVFSWQALGIYDLNEGVFVVAPDETVQVEITVDFENLPDFP